MKHEKRYFLFTWLGAIIGGSALHFLYSALPNPLTALIAPVNESVWEHLKLLYYPTLLAAYLLSQCTMERQRLWSGFLLAELAMPLFLVGVYYLLVCGFGVEGLLVDIGLYIVTMAGGFALAYAFYRKGVDVRTTGVLLMLVIFYGAFLVVFSFAAPHFGIFLPQ